MIVLKDFTYDIIHEKYKIKDMDILIAGERSIVYSNGAKIIMQDKKGYYSRIFES